MKFLTAKELHQDRKYPFRWNVLLCNIAFNWSYEFLTGSALFLIEGWSLFPDFPVFGFLGPQRECRFSLSSARFERRICLAFQVKRSFDSSTPSINPRILALSVSTEDGYGSNTLFTWLTTRLLCILTFFVLHYSRALQSY